MFKTGKFALAAGLTAGAWFLMRKILFMVFYWGGMMPWWRTFCFRFGIVKMPALRTGAYAFMPFMGGVILGTLFAFIGGYILGYLFSWFYNKLTEK